MKINNVRDKGNITICNQQMYKYIQAGLFSEKFDIDDNTMNDSNLRYLIENFEMNDLTFPEDTEEELWKEIIAKILFIKERLQIKQMLVKAGIHPYIGLVNKMQKLNHMRGRFLNMKEIKILFQSQGDKLAEEIVKGLKKEKQFTNER